MRSRLALVASGVCVVAVLVAALLSVPWFANAVDEEEQPRDLPQTPSDPIAHSSPKECLEAFVESLSRGDLAEALSHCTPSAEEPVMLMLRPSERQNVRSACRKLAQALSDDYGPPRWYFESDEDALAEFPDPGCAYMTVAFKKTKDGWRVHWIVPGE